MLCYTAAEDCGGNYTQNSGTIDYPLVNSSYGYEYCVWRVQLPDSSSRIAVNVTGFHQADGDYLKACIYTLYQESL